MSKSLWYSIERNKTALLLENNNFMVRTVTLLHDIGHLTLTTLTLFQRNTHHHCVIPYLNPSEVSVGRKGITVSCNYNNRADVFTLYKIVPSILWVVVIFFKDVQRFKDAVFLSVCNLMCHLFSWRFVI